MLRVHIAENDRDTADTMCRLVELWGYDVRVSYNGTDALEEALKFLPHVVLLDIGLPGLDGIELGKRLRAQKLKPDPLLIGITGYGSASMRTAALAAGIDEYLIKPLNPSVLEEFLCAARADLLQKENSTALQHLSAAHIRSEESLTKAKV